LKRTGVLLIAVMLELAACGDDNGAATTTAATERTSGPTETMPPSTLDTPASTDAGGADGWCIADTGLNIEELSVDWSAGAPS